MYGVEALSASFLVDGDGVARHAASGESGDAPGVGGGAGPGRDEIDKRDKQKGRRTAVTLSAMGSPRRAGAGPEDVSA